MVVTVKVEDSLITLEVENTLGIQSITWDVNTLTGNISLGSTGLISSQLQQIAIVAGIGIQKEISKIKEEGLYWVDKQGSETSGSNSSLEN